MGGFENRLMNYPDFLDNFRASYGDQKEENTSLQFFDIFTYIVQTTLFR